ncbi:DUF3880 domain-containing protein, partial [Lachnospiraceae bacterium OttesenSCG-928-D06]|nr:DUF3880 domain-containing protein [Lachnospiraceae bacterium OttesenSCG-928-D06]
WNNRNVHSGEDLQCWFSRTVDLFLYDAIFSLNYISELSKICNEHKIKYIAWTYEPLCEAINVKETIDNKCNHIFSFDRKEVQQKQNAGIDTVRHLPMGIHLGRLKKTRISKEDRLKYSADISFVGDLYEKETESLTQNMNDAATGYIEALIDMQSILYGCYFLEELMNEKVFYKILCEEIKSLDEDEMEVKRVELINRMAYMATRKERLILINLLGKYHDMRCYCSESRGILDDTDRRYISDYMNEFPKIAVCSKINLSPTTRNIQTAIPVQSLEIMGGGGGFLLSNYQEELVENYVDGEEVVVYESYVDAMEKATYYLKHKETREQIRKNGYIKTCASFNMDTQIKTILKNVEL